MTIRILFLALVSILSGCASPNLPPRSPAVYLRNPHLYVRDACIGNILPALSDRALCWAASPEYREDRRAAMPSADKPDEDEEKEVDPRYKEMVP
jgi:hypothetical protein